MDYDNTEVISDIVCLLQNWQSDSDGNCIFV